jgi:hypothetical protein
MIEIGGKRQEQVKLRRKKKRHGQGNITFFFLSFFIYKSISIEAGTTQVNREKVYKKDPNLGRKKRTQVQDFSKKLEKRGILYVAIQPSIKNIVILSSVSVYNYKWNPTVSGFKVSCIGPTSKSRKQKKTLSV